MVSGSLDFAPAWLEVEEANMELLRCDSRRLEVVNCADWTQGDNDQLKESLLNGNYESRRHVQQLVTRGRVARDME